jgi:hypothetical protein
MVNPKQFIENIEKTIKMEKVIFLKDKEINSVFAFFVEPEYGQYVCYDIIGGHSGCSLEYIIECEEAKEDEYLSIYKILTNVYEYDLEICTKESIDFLIEVN